MVGKGATIPGNSFYFQQFILKLRASLDLVRWERAWREVVSRHEVLRTRISTDEKGHFVQSFPQDGEVEFDCRDLRHLPPAEKHTWIEEYLEADRRRGFDFARDRLTRWHHFILGEEASWLVWTSHHAILDGRSRMEVLEEVFACYHADTGGVSIPPCPRPGFTEYLRWLRGLDRDKAERFWRASLHGLESAVALDFAFPQEQALDADPGQGRLSLRLGPELSGALKNLAQSQDVTLNTVLQSAWALLLSRSTGCSDVVFGASRACRHSGLPEGDKVIGLLTHTVPMRIHCREDVLLGDWFKEIRGHWLAMRPHERLPLTLIHGVSPLEPGTPLFESLMSFENAPMEVTLRRLGEPFTLAETELRAASHYPLVLQGYDGEDVLLELTHDRRRFGDATASAWLGHLVHLLRQFVETPVQALSRFTLLSPGQETAVFSLLNQPAEALEEDRSLAAIFLERAGSHPHAVAVDDGCQSLSYGELAHRAQRLALRLREAGIMESDRVAVSADRSLGMVVSIIAALHAGASYVPVDPAEPRERLVGMLKDCEVKVILHDPQHSHAFAPDEAGEWSLLSHHDAPAAHATSLVLPGQAGIACILYTSGSAGRPKGVLLKHTAIAGLVLRTSYTRITPEDVVGQVANCCFDAATFEIWGALLNGARLTLLSKDCLLQAGGLAREISERKISILLLTTGLFHELARQDPGMFHRLRQLLVGGEVLSPEIVSRVMAAGPPARFTNAYGPTEITTIATSHDVPPDHDWSRPIPIGRPISRARVYVLDPSLRVLPPGIPGELYVSGPGVAQGYLNLPDLTAEKFLLCPFEEEGVMYRTGDWVRVLPTGVLEFLGRRDAQAKIRGHRVEPGEIEMALLKHPAVKQGVVTVQSAEGPLEQTCLVGHVVLHPGSRVTVGGLKAFLRTQLQAFLIPAHFRVLERFPLNRNGKVDRAQLSRASGVDLPLSRAVDGAVTPTEVVVHRLWSGLFGGQALGVRDDFFELGGNSLLAIRLFALVDKEFDLRLTPAAFFQRCTVEGLASWIDASRSDRLAVPSSPAPSEGSETSWPLSAQQRRLWEMAKEDPSFGAWNVTRRVRLRGVLDVEALVAAFQSLVQRHEALRIVIRCEAGEDPVQAVTSLRSLDLSCRDVSDLSPADQSLLLSRTARDEVWRPLDLAVAPLRLLLLKLGAEDHAMIITVHHCVCDGASLAVLLEDLGEIYSAKVTRRTPDLPTLSGELVWLPEWERQFIASGEGRAIAAHWRTVLEKFPPPVKLPSLPAAGMKPDLRGRSLLAKISPDLGRRLRELARELRTSPFSIFFSVFAVLVHGITQRDRFVIMTPFARRMEAWMQGVVGMFTNALPLSFELSGNRSFAQLVEETRVRLLGTLQVQGYPAAEIAKMAKKMPAASQLQRCLVQLDFIELPPLDIGHRFHGLQAGLEPVEHQTIRNDLRVAASLSTEPMALRFDYPISLFEEAVVAQFLERYVRLLHLVAADPSMTLDQLVITSSPDFPCEVPASAHR